MQVNSNQNLKPFFSEIAQEVVQTLEQAETNNVSWFQAPPLRKTIFYQLYRDALDWYPDKTRVTTATVTGIWNACSQTAAIMLTRIAPISSYQGKEGEILQFAMDNPSYTKNKGIDLLQSTLNKPLKEGERQAIICDLYKLHAFLVERISSTECVIYQSYVEAYTLDECLSDPNKMINWKTEKLIKNLTKILNSKLNIDKRIKNFKKLFYSDKRLNLLQSRDSFLYPLNFVETQIYKSTNS